jgi:hypothetical protein
MTPRKAGKMAERNLLSILITIDTDRQGVICWLCRCAFGFVVPVRNNHPLPVLASRARAFLYQKEPPRMAALFLFFFIAQQIARLTVKKLAKRFYCSRVNVSALVDLLPGGLADHLQAGFHGVRCDSLILEFLNQLVVSDRHAITSTINYIKRKSPKQVTICTKRRHYLL